MKHKTIMIAGYAILVSILTFSFYGIGQSLASGNYGNKELGSDDDDYSYSLANENPIYIDECSSCHMAYPPQLLPAPGWQKIMHGLEDHFGENAEIDATTREVLENYLVQSSSTDSYQKLFRNLGNHVPLRITELPYFIHEHDEIPSRFIQANDKVSSLSQCNACHLGAERGQFDEDDVIIPGVGRWDD
jgi:hypothetical protein